MQHNLYSMFKCFILVSVAVAVLVVAIVIDCDV